MSSAGIDEQRFRTTSVPASRIIGDLSAEELRHHLLALEKITEAALAHLSLSDLLPEILQRLRTVLRADTATVLLRDEARSMLVVRASRGLEGEVEQEVEVPLGEGIVGAAAMHGEAVIVDDVTRFHTVSPILRTLASMMLAPLRADGELVGVIHVGSIGARTFTDVELHLLQVAADRVALSLRNAILYDEAQQQIVERERVEKALVESEARHRILADTAADAIVTIDPQSVIISANPAAGEAFGYTVDELIGRSFVELIPKRFRARHRAGLRQYIETGERRLRWRGIELPGLRRDGREVMLEIAFAERVVDGQRFFTGTMRDITERKRNERNLAVQFAATRVLAEVHAVEEAVRMILAGVGEALGWSAGDFWLWDAEEQRLRLTGLWLAPELEDSAFGTASEEFTFRPGVGLPGRAWESREPQWVLDVTTEGNFPRLNAALDAGLRSAFAFPVCIGNDCIGVMGFFADQIIEPDAALLETMHALGSDIGQFIRRREAEERAEAQEQIQAFFAQVSSALAASVLDYDATLRKLAHLAVPILADGCSVTMRRDDGTVVRVEVVHQRPEMDSVIEELTQYPLQPDPRHPAMNVLNTGEPVLVPDVDDEFIATIAQDDGHAELIRRTGMRSMMVVPLIARGRILGAVTLAAFEGGHPPYDAKDLRTAEEFARRAALAVDNARLYRESMEANRAKAEFLATVSHELRTPLNAVIGYGDLLRMGITEGDRAKTADYAERIQVSARHLAQLIEEVLAFSRMESGRERVVVEPARLNDLLAEVHVITEPLAAEKNIGLVFAPPDESIDMITDARKIRQILLNLIGNAVKFTADGEVAVRVERLDDAVSIEIQDTGVGIGAEHLEKVFEPFWQVEQGTTRTVGGTGLGLTVSRRFAELLGGDIQIESEIGKGTTVRVHLPLRTTPRDDPQKGSSA